MNFEGLNFQLGSYVRVSKTPTTYTVDSSSVDRKAFLISIATGFDFKLATISRALDMVVLEFEAKIIIKNQIKKERHLKKKKI